MITGEYEQLKDLADNNVCAADNGHLVVCWDKEANVYRLKCGICDKTKAITRVLSLTEEHKAGAELPPVVKDKVEQGIEKRQAKHPVPAGAVTMGGIPATDLGTGELLKIEVLKALAAYARGYGLDPARGHVCLMYGKPYITADGYYYHANKSGIPYTIESRPLNAGEVTSYQIPSATHAWIAMVRLLETGAFLTGLGIVTQEEMTAKSPRDAGKLRSPVVAAHPWQLAQKRAEWQAMRRAFPIGESPQGEES